MFFSPPVFNKNLILSSVGLLETLFNTIGLLDGGVTSPPGETRKTIENVTYKVVFSHKLETNLNSNLKVASMTILQFFLKPVL